jgi:transposase InsO family protein
MIHDHATQFNINYIEYGIKSIKTSVEAPNMNAIAERFVGSVRQEVLDFYILINEKQIQRILDEYINYYNSKRPHQGIDQKVPRMYKPQIYGKVQKLPILGGLHHHYSRSAA